MNYNIDKALKPYFNIRAMLKGIDRHLWGLFLPETERELAALETSILALKARESDRDQVMSIQRLCGLAFHPNEPLREVKSKARVKGLKNDRRRRFDDDDPPDGR